MINDEILYKQIKSGRLTLEQAILALKQECPVLHDLPLGFTNPERGKNKKFEFRNVYGYNDLIDFQEMINPQMTHGRRVSIRSLEELLERDTQREKDGFPRKINVGRLIKPGKSGKDKVVIVPSTVEEKFYHSNNFDPTEDQSGGGSGDGEEGEVIGEEKADQEEGSGAGPGQGEGGQHEIESNAYDLGKILTEKFELPNLKDKGKKKSLTRYTYDLTDKHQGFGQLLDKKSTLRKIVRTNISLGRLDPHKSIDPAKFLISPQDMIYRILSKEKAFESQAMVFFLRDYSGSMSGKRTEIVSSQHVLIYSWLLYQYNMNLETRFILHDTEAKEVPDFHTYHNSKVAGGTQVFSGYELILDMIEKNNLDKDYNIYIFQGTDGDDWDTDGSQSIPILKKLFKRDISRMGITVVNNATTESEVEKYISKFIKHNKSLTRYLRIDKMREDADEPRIIDGIKHLISE